MAPPRPRLAAQCPHPQSLTTHHASRINPPISTCNLQPSTFNLGEMFTGIVEETGMIERVHPARNSIELIVRMRTCGRGLKLGDSLAINGCCLTVTKLR